MDFKEELANYQQTINQGIEKYLKKQILFLFLINQRKYGW